MNRPITAKINVKNHLEIGGCDCVDLVRDFGTPLYVMDEVTLRGKCREYRSAFKDRYPNNLIIYASKALCATNILKIVNDEGLGVDVSSGGELYTAKKAGVNLQNVFFHGNNKTEKELEEAITLGIGRIVVDNAEELENIGRLAVKLNKKIKILFRVNPGIEAHTHEFIQTGNVDSKFGIAKTDVINFVKKSQKMENVEFCGLHSHIGSQIFDLEPYSAVVDILAQLSLQILRETKIRVEDINIGGGIGIDYSGNDNVPSLDSFAEKIAKRLKIKCEEYGLGNPRLILEPGRSIVGISGVTLYSVGSIKKIPGIKTYISVDGGMSDNPRPILYGAKYEAIVANKANLKSSQVITIAGRFCESGDKLIEDYEFPEVSYPDIIAVFCTGAYNYSMASNYNRVPRPAIVMVNNGTPSLVVKRESYEDLVQNDI